MMMQHVFACSYRSIIAVEVFALYIQWNYFSLLVCRTATSSIAWYQGLSVFHDHPVPTDVDVSFMYFVIF